jgi:hypothetical protein
MIFLGSNPNPVIDVRPRWYGRSMSLGRCIA